MLDFAYFAVTALNILWFGAAFHYFSIKQFAAAKVLVPKSSRDSPLFLTIAASVRFLGGMNLAFAVLSLPCSCSWQPVLLQRTHSPRRWPRRRISLGRPPGSNEVHLRSGCNATGRECSLVPHLLLREMSAVSSQESSFGIKLGVHERSHFFQSGHDLVQRRAYKRLVFSSKPSEDHATAAFFFN
jgi:hypothetical protein